MERLHQNILKDLRQKIVDDMDVHNGIISPLTAKYILKKEDVEQIEAGTSNEHKAAILLDILPKCGPNAFDAFREALRHHYRWLSQDMDKLESRETCRDDVIYTAQSPIIPPTSSLSVTREEKVKQLTRALRNLGPNAYLILHGMKGFGKSWLTASTLKDSALVQDLFQNKVYWLKFGYDSRYGYENKDKHTYKRSIDEEITIQLNTLYHRVRNMEVPPESLKFQPLKDFLMHFLTNHFNKKENRNCLLVLDDVYDKNIIKAFDFECKTLVITTDIDVLDEKRGTVIQMNDGFTEGETLGLFAKVLDTDVDRLPMEAKLIHKECRGMPLLIAMFSAHFEEFKNHMKIYTDKWNYYLNCIQTKDTKNKVINKFFEKQETIFNMSIERLPLELKTCYEQLAIFSEDVNITPKTLEVLWSHNIYQVEEMMLELCHKSLAAMRWNDNLGYYIYGVHDLLLCHLRRKLGKDKLTEMHKLFIEKYRKSCNNDFSKLPNDNYSYSYIGHHLELAELYHEFPKLYLDFKFLEAKINHTGLCDLLIDFKKYRKYITNNNDESYEGKVIDIENFLQEQASNISKHRRKKCLDLVQIAMNHFNPGYVMETATNLAKERTKHLYVSHSTNITMQQTNVTQTEEVCTETNTSCFTSDPNVILIGNKTGDIIQWNCKLKKQVVYKVYDNEFAIEKIVVSGKGKYFLALCNGIVKLFPLYNNDYFTKSDIHIQSPRQKQVFWNDIYATNGHSSLRTFLVENEIILDMAFGHDDERIAACTDKGTIQVWDHCGNILTSITHDGNCLRYITFTTESTLLHTMDISRNVLVTYTEHNDNYTYSSQYNPQLTGEKVIFFHNVPGQDNSLIIVTEKKAVYVKWFRSQISDRIYNYSSRKQSENEKTDYICAAVTYDGRYLVLADSEGFLYIWQLVCNFHPIAVYKSHVTSLDTCWLIEEGYHYICGNENNLLHTWKLPIEEASNQVRDLLFDAVVQSFGEADVIAKKTKTNTVVILHGNNIIAESNPANEDIISLRLSPDGKKLIYITEENMVTLFDIENKTATNIFRLPEGAEFIKFLTIESNEVIIGMESNKTLRVWKNTKIAYLVADAGYIISIHEVNNEYVITVTQDGVITLYNISGTKWTIISITAIENVNIYFSCFSYIKHLLVMLTTSKHVLLYYLQEDTTVEPPCIRIELYYRHLFEDKPTYCDISQDQKYLAVGFETGDIAIIDVQKKSVIRTYSFHTNAIIQLNWAPSTTEVPILLSVNRDELAWWNIQLTCDTHKKYPNCKGIIRSVSTPVVGTSTNSFLPTSYSIDISTSLSNSSVQTLQDDKTGNSSSYWKSKVGRDNNNPALLCALQLPTSCIPRVCISADFSKFITVDIYGSVSTFKLFDYS